MEFLSRQNKVTMSFISGLFSVFKRKQTNAEPDPVPVNSRLTCSLNVEETVDDSGSLTFWRELVKNGDLEKLFFKENYRPQLGIRISRIILFLPQIEVVELYECPLGDANIVLLCRALSSSAFLLDPTKRLELDLRFCNMNNVGALALASLIDKNPSLHRLATLRNPMDDVGYKAICGALGRRDRLTDFSSIYEDNLGMAAARTMAQLIHCSQNLRNICLATRYRSEGEQLFCFQISELVDAAYARQDIHFGVAGYMMNRYDLR